MHYLVATDGSEVSELAVEQAAADASVWDAPLKIVHVLAPKAELVEGEIVLPGGDEAIDQGSRTLEAARKTASRVAEEHGTDIEITTELLSGNPPDAITDHAADIDARRIYVGHRGLSAEREQVVGSVAKTVLDKASIPVIIVR